jgi:hypothetical protein
MCSHGIINVCRRTYFVFVIGASASLRLSLQRLSRALPTSAPMPTVFRGIPSNPC